MKSYFKLFRNISEQNWSWGIHEFSVNYDDVDSNVRCSTNQLGKKLFDLDNIFGPLSISDNTTLFREFDSSVLNGGKFCNKFLSVVICKIELYWLY